VLYEQGEDRATLDLHLTQPHMIKHHEEARPGFNGKIEMVTYEVIYEVVFTT
jgi:quinol monooxygenase YgiN